MTHQAESNHFEKLIQVLDEHGFAGMAQALEIHFNEAMKIERRLCLARNLTNVPSSVAVMPTAISPSGSPLASGSSNCKSRRPAASSSIPTGTVGTKEGPTFFDGKGFQRFHDPRRVAFHEEH